MASVVISGDTSGSVTLSAPAVAGSSTQTLVAATGTLAPLVSGTAQATTSGTSKDFTDIPSWVKRVTVIFQNVSTSGTSFLIIQIGSGSFITTGYVGYSYLAPGVRSVMSTGFLLAPNLAANSSINGSAVINLINGNTWVETGVVLDSSTSILSSSQSAGNLALGGTLDRVRVTTVNGTDTFDAGTINIMYE